MFTFRSLWDAGVGPQVSGEAKGFIDSQAVVHKKHGSAGHLGLLEDMAPLFVKDTVDVIKYLF